MANETSKVERLALARAEKQNIVNSIEGLLDAGIDDHNPAIKLLEQRLEEMDNSIERLSKGLSGEASRAAVAAILRVADDTAWSEAPSGDLSRKFKLAEIDEEIRKVESERDLLDYTVGMLEGISGHVESVNIPIEGASVRVVITGNKAGLESATRAASGPRASSAKKLRIVNVGTPTPDNHGWLPFPETEIEGGLIVGNFAAFVDDQVSEGFIMTTEEHAKRRYKNEQNNEGGYKEVNWRKELTTKYGLSLQDVPVEETAS